MDKEILGNLFLSYSHADKPYMLMFRKHLKGMLLDKMHVWSDQDISKGAGWESFLKGNLTQASSALVLASPDYLISPWCRQELKALAAAQRARRLRNLFWVQLKPCGWQHTELSEFQSLETSVEQAITESPNETQRDRAILQACEQIVSGISRSIIDKDKQLGLVRRLLLNGPDPHNLTVNEVLQVGTFSIVCRGSIGPIDVVIKMLRRAPLEKMTEDFLRIGKQRMNVVDPAFVRIHDIFQVDAEDEKRTFIVSEYVNYAALLSTFLEKGEPVPVDKAAALLRRTSEALAALHEAGGRQQDEADKKGEWEWTLGLVTPGDIYYDTFAGRLRMAPFGVSSFLWHVLDWNQYVGWVNPKAKAYIAPEQVNRPGVMATRKTDQYMLGRLALELLEGKPFDLILGEQPAREFLKDPGSFIKGTWKDDHRQLWDILRIMLKEDPDQRWKSMTKVAHKFRALEETGRALAKRVYLPPCDNKVGDTAYLKDNVEFFKQFYDTFFLASKESKQKFGNVQEQHRKLMDSMVAVLNFREGNRPTSLDAFLQVHRSKGVTKREFEKFHESFLATLDRFFGGDRRIVEAWDDLFKPAVDYMIAECVESDATTPASGVAREGVRDRDSLGD